MLGHYLYSLCRWKLLSTGQFKVEGKLSIYLTWHMYTSLLFPGITFFLNAVIQYWYVCPCDTLKTFQQGSKYFNSVTWTSLSVPSCLKYLENCFKLTFSLELWWPCSATFSRGRDIRKNDLGPSITIHFRNDQVLCAVLLINSLTSFSHNSFLDCSYFRKGHSIT